MPKVTFETFQRVLVRNYDTQHWCAAFYSSNDSESPEFPHRITGGTTFKQCIPYNDETAHLLGTADSPTSPETEFRFGDKVAISYDGKDWQWAIYVRKVDGDMPHEVYMQVPWHYGGQEYHVKFCRHEEW